MSKRYEVVVTTTTIYALNANSEDSAEMYAIRNHIAGGFDGIELVSEDSTTYVTEICPVCDDTGHHDISVVVRGKNRVVKVECQHCQYGQQEDGP